MYYLPFCITLLPATRKMCVVLQNVPFSSPTPILARGFAAHPRCIPRLWCIRHRAFMHQRTFGRSITIGGASKLPPNPPWSMGDFALPLNPHRPKSFQCPLETLTNRAPIGCRECFATQSRPLFRQRITTKEASLDVMQQCAIGYFGQSTW